MPWWAISQWGPARGAMFLCWIFWVLMFLLRLVFLRLLTWQVLDLSLHSARSDWSDFCHLRDDWLPLLLNIWSFISFRIQNRINCFHLWVLIWQFLSIFFILLPFVMLINYLGSHTWNMGCVLSVWLLVERSACGWALHLCVLFAVIQLSRCSLGI